MKAKTIRHSLTFLITSILVLFNLVLSFSEEPKKLAIISFTMNSDRDLDFFGEGIVDMLSSRLTWKEKLDVINKEIVNKEISTVPGPVNETKAFAIGKAVGADFVIFGSLTVLGESVSLDAKILDVKKSEILITAYDQCKGMDEVIPAVNRFAENINAKIMGKDIPHPEQRSGAFAQQDEGGLVNVGEDTTGSYKKPTFVKRFKLEIRGLDLGDVDGDGKNELVFIDKTAVYVYKWQEKGSFLFKRIEGTWSPNYIYLTVADLDENGKAEIYVCNLTTTNAASLVLEWDGAQFKEILHGQPWLIRVVDLPHKGKTLLGQRRNAEGNYMGGVHFLKRKGKDFVSIGSITLPRFSNLFNFAQCDLSGKGSIFTILLDPWEHLLVNNQAGEQLWKKRRLFWREPLLYGIYGSE